MVLLRSEDWLYEKIAQALKIQEKTISRHLEDYLDSKKLIIASGGLDGKLNGFQTRALITPLES